MVTKNKIKNLLPIGSICKSEVIEKIQIYTERYNKGFINSRNVVIGLFIAASMSEKQAVLSFEKIQEYSKHVSIVNPCHSCGESWPVMLDTCPNCGEKEPF